jgi:hypothetical protein
MDANQFAQLAELAIQDGFNRVPVVHKVLADLVIP